MRQGSKITVPSTGVALLLEQAKRQLRVELDDTDEDVHIGDLCRSAHRRVENELGYPILRGTVETHLKCFPRGSIWLGGGDDAQVQELRYIDADGANQTVDPANYYVDAIGRVASVHPAPDFTWPRTLNVPGAVVVEWQAGWTAPDQVPEDLVHAMKLLVGHWDLNREAVVVGLISVEVQETLDAILEQYRTRFVA